MACIGMTGQLTEPVDRIVSLAPSLTETLFSLGLGPLVAGVTEQCDVPPEAAEKPRVGTFSQPDVERISAARADIVLGLGRFHARFAGRLAEAGIPLVTFEYRTVEDVFSCMREIARIAGAKDAAASGLDRLRDRVERVRRAAERRRAPRVFRLMTDDPLVTPSLSCYQTDAMRIAGAETMELDVEEPYTPVGIDEVVRFDPQVVLSCGHDGERRARRRCKGCRASTPLCLRDVSRLATQDGWSRVSAAGEGRIHAIPCGVLCRPGPRIVDGIELMATLFSR